MRCSFCGRNTNDMVFQNSDKTAYVCIECAKKMMSIYREQQMLTKIQDGSSKNHDKSLLRPSQIKAKLDEYIIGQDEAKMALSVAVYNHYKRISDHIDDDNDVVIQKSNVLMLGPTGCGKTYLAKTLADILSVPFAMADATSLTESGYVGDDVETVLFRLLENADNDLEEAQRGIVYIDEIDKLSRCGENPSITRDVSGEGVQQALLKIIEGTKSRVPLHAGRKNPTERTVEMDTSNILFICGGAFEGIDKVIEKKNTPSKIGFSTNIDAVEEEPSRDIQASDIIKYGMTPEFIGRLPIITVLKPLDKTALINILTQPKNAITKQYKRLFAMDGVTLEFTEEALDSIAEKAINRKSGARGLRSVLEKSMQKVMFSVPDYENVKKAVITAEVIDGSADALLYGESDQKIAI